MDSLFLCYKDGLQLPPLNFSTSCMTFGRYVTFNNERINGDEYPQGYQLESVLTELCEVIVLGEYFYISDQFIYLFIFIQKYI